MTSSNPDSRSEMRCVDPVDPARPCPVCGGLGVVQYDVPPDHKLFGKLIPCPNLPDTIDDERLERLRRMSNLDAFRQKTFADFEISPVYEESQQRSLQTALHKAQDFAQQPSGWLLLEGPYGCGKTHLAAAIGNLRLERGEDVLFITTPDLLDHLRSAYSPKAEIAYDELFERVRNTHLLILDDLGVENPSPWAQEKLFQLLNHRYAHQQATVITTNTQLDALDGRIRSRLLDREVVSRLVINAPDYRAQAGPDDDMAANLSLYRHMTFETFETYQHLMPDERQNLKNALAAAKSYAQDAGGYWFVLIGHNKDPKRQFGNGKTHLAAAIANYQSQHGHGHHVVFATISDLMDYLRGGFDKQSNLSFELRFRNIRNAHLLVIDDLQVENSTDWVKERIFQILDYRYVRRLPTVITMPDFKHIGNRLRSRLMDEQRVIIFRLEARPYGERIKRTR